MKVLSQQQWANITKVILIVGWLFLMNSLMSCSSSCPKKRYPTRLKRCTLVSKDTVPDYFFINNQIVIIERQR
jgi:hypothetical protein